MALLNSGPPGMEFIAENTMIIASKIENPRIMSKKFLILNGFSFLIRYFFFFLGWFFITGNHANSRPGYILRNLHLVITINLCTNLIHH